MSTDLVPTSSALVAGVQIDYTKVLEHLKLSPRDPKAQALVLVCQRYNLDPVLKHVLLVDGDVYVTHKGLLHIAHSSGVFDGIEVIEQGETDTHWTARASVWRSDKGRAFTYPGRYPKLRPVYEWSGPAGNRTKRKVGEEAHPYGPEMAIKTAECMALRRAFDVALPVEEERWDLDRAEPTQVRRLDDPPADHATQQSTPVTNARSAGAHRAPRAGAGVGTSAREARANQSATEPGAGSLGRAPDAPGEVAAPTSEAGSSAPPGASLGPDGDAAGSGPGATGRHNAASPTSAVQGNPEDRPADPVPPSPSPMGLGWFTALCEALGVEPGEAADYVAEHRQTVREQPTQAERIRWLDTVPGPGVQRQLTRLIEAWVEGQGDEEAAS